MADRLSAIEQQLVELQRRLEGLEARMEAAEARGIAAGIRSSPAQSAVEEELPPIGFNFTSFLTLSGRSLIILGGAYLIRAITDTKLVPPTVGVALGIAYAVVWILAAGRAAGKSWKSDAIFHSVTAAAIAFPLVVEATLRFHILGPGSSAAALAFLSALSLAVAWRFNHQIMAWIVTVAALITAGVLMISTGAVLSIEAFLLALGLGTLWLGYDREWTFLRWPVGLMADFVALGLVLRAIKPDRPDPPGLVIALLMALVGSYVASFAVRTLVRGRNVLPFEIFQTAATLLVGFGGSVMVVRATHASALSLGVISFALGLAAYAVAYAFISRTHGKNINFHFYTVLALVFTVTGLPLLTGGTILVLSFCVLALIVTLFGKRYNHAALLLHGFTYLLGAALVSNVLVDAGSYLAGDAATHLRQSEWNGWLVLAASIACALTLNRKRESEVVVMTRVARLGQVGLLLVLLGGATIYLVLTPIAHSLGHAFQQGGIAILRTAVFASAAVALAAVARRWTIHEMGWLAWAVLGLTGLEVVVEDLRYSGPALLFMALAIFGIALVLVPRLLAKTRPQET